MITFETIQSVHIFCSTMEHNTQYLKNVQQQDRDPRSHLSCFHIVQFMPYFNSAKYFCDPKSQLSTYVHQKSLHYIIISYSEFYYYCITLTSFDHCDRRSHGPRLELFVSD
jgi:hypothetical protein